MAGQGRKPIHPTIAAQVERIYGETRSSRQTAKRCGISDRSVRRIVAGRHHPAERREPDPAEIERVYHETQSQRETARRLGLSKTTVQKILADEPTGQNGLGAAEIKVVAILCPGCRNWIEVQPCRICAQRRYENAQRTIALLREIAAKVAEYRLRYEHLEQTRRRRNDAQSA